jgi:hypothetical protein
MATTLNGARAGPHWTQGAPPLKTKPCGDVKRWWAFVALLLLMGCREVRVKTYAVGTTTVPGGNQIVVVRDAQALGRLGIHEPIHFRGEFGVVLLMGPHDRTGYRQIIESIDADDARVRVVAFEEAPPNGGEPTSGYRTFTLWIIPNTVYRRGIHVEVVTPADAPVADTVLP